MGDYRSENPFLLLDDENEDPQALVKSAPAKSGADAKKAATAAGKSATPIKTDTRQAGRAPARTGGRDLLGEGGATVEASGERGRGRGGRDGRGRGRGGRGRGDYGDRPPREYGDRPPRDYSDRPPRRDYERPAGDADVSEGVDESASREGYGLRGGGRFGGRGRGGGGRGRGSGRNYFDRHDNTGRGHEFVKRGGAGKGNWGAEGEESQEQGAPDESKPELRGENANVPAGEELPNGAAPHADAGADVEEEEEAPTMTLDEWEKIAAEKRAGLNKSNKTAKVDLKQFEGMAVVDKPDPEEDALDLTAVKALGKKKQGFEKEKKTKQVVEDVGFKFDEPHRGGGRGRGRGRGGRSGGGRGYGGYERSDYGGGRGRSDAGVAQLNDSAFPALS